jgi:hypothetical protein
MKACSKCGVAQNLEAFAKLGKGRSSPDGRNAQCKTCLNAKGKAWRDSKTRVYHRMYRYGLSEDAYYSMLDGQGHKCALCGNDDPRRKQGFVVDHCHATGKIRGLLCHPCNIALGMLGDDAAGLQRALDYVKKGNL